MSQLLESGFFSGKSKYLVYETTYIGYFAKVVPVGKCVCIHCCISHIIVACIQSESAHFSVSCLGNAAIRT